MRPTAMLDGKAPIGRWARACLLAATGLMGCAQGAQSSLETASSLMYAGEFAAAQKTLRQLLKSLDAQRPLDASGQNAQLAALDRLGKINALYLRDYPQAIADLSQLVRRYPQTPEAQGGLLAMANIYQYRQNKLSEAIVTYEQLVQNFANSPQAPAAQLAIVDAYFKLKDYQQARQEAGRIIQTWPQSSEATRASFDIADAYYRERQFTEAVATYEALLRDKPAAKLEALVRFEMGNCYQELGEPQRALDAYYRALAEHPNPALVQRKIARVRSRIYNLAPSEGILNAPPPSRRMLALQHRRMSRGPNKP